MKEDVTRKVVAKKSEEKAGQVGEDLLKKIRGGKDIREVAREAGLSVEETGFFTRTAGGHSKDRTREGFGTHSGDPHGEEPSFQRGAPDQGRLFYCPALSRRACGSNKFGSLQKDLEKRLNSQKQEEFFQNWIAQLKSKATIDINQDVLK